MISRAEFPIYSYQREKKLMSAKHCIIVNFGVPKIERTSNQSRSNVIEVTINNFRYLSFNQQLRHNYN